MIAHLPVRSISACPLGRKGIEAEDELIEIVLEVVTSVKLVEIRDWS
jgi:hypothetical protein